MCRDLKPENLLIEVGDFGCDGFGFATVPTTCTLCCEYAYALCEYLGGKGGHWNWNWYSRALSMAATRPRSAPPDEGARRRWRWRCAVPASMYV